MMADELASLFRLQPSDVRIIDRHNDIPGFQLAMFGHSAVGNYATNNKASVERVGRNGDAKTCRSLVDSNCSNFTGVDDAFWLLRKVWFRVGAWNVEFFVVGGVFCFGDLNGDFWNAFDFVGSVVFYDFNN